MDSKAEDRLWIAAGAAALALVAVFCGIAIAMLVTGGGEGGSWPPSAYMMRVVLFTVGQALASTALSLLLALPVALAMARRPRFPGRSLLLVLMILPLGLPVLPAVFGIVEIWGRQGVVSNMLKWLGFDGSFSLYGLAGILLAHVFFNMPLAARLMLNGLRRIPDNQWRLAAGLDFPRTALFRFVEWPALLRVLPGIAGLVFMLCITSFTIVLTLGGGPATSTLEVAIYQALKFEYDPPRALALSLLQLMLTAGIFLLLNRLPDPQEDRSAAEGAPFRPDARSIGSIMLDCLVLALFMLFVGSPLLAVVAQGLGADFGHLLPDALFLQALLTSLLIAVTAGGVSVYMTMTIARGQIALTGRGHGRWVGLFRLPEFTLMVPPLALGAGWFLLLLKSGIEGDPAIPIVISINTIMALPFTSRVFGPELRSHQIRTARLADSLDIHGLDRIRIIDWPVLKIPLLTALSFGMALSLGDMGAIALFGSDDFITLPSLLYGKLGSYRSTDAAGLSLILAMLCLLLMLPALSAEVRKDKAST